MNEPTDAESADDVEATLDEAEIISQPEADRRAQQHDFFRKRDVWPRGPRR